jgi:LPS export ABC transporter protein LptC
VNCKRKIKDIIKFFAVLATGTAIFFSCDSELEIITGTDVKDLPSLTVRNFQTVHTDSGRIQLILKSPVMERYSNATDPYNEFPDGVEVIFYDGQAKQVASLSSKYAKYYEEKKMWELKYDVRARNEKNELLETELLFWEEEKESVFTDKFVRITGEDRIVSGTGFESDTRFSVWEIRNGNAIIYLKDE